MSATPIRDAMDHALQQAFTPAHMELKDDSHNHAGHSGSRPEGETHFRLTLVSEKFKDMNRVGRQRAVYAALDALLKTRVHALQLSLYTPEEFASKS